ncbi:ZNHI3 protein, partial [Dasyornis broadbenti]|nr:ZNHI3 protein [Dasyornis broadbenti]
MRAPGPCAECGARGAARYRCPRCGTAYCSVPCCRTHRGEWGLEGPGGAGRGRGRGRAGANAGLPWSVEDILSEEDEQDRVPLQKLKLLGKLGNWECSWVDLLLNPHLRQLLLTIDQAQDKSSLMRKFMQEPLFVEFADCCLRIVEPPEKENMIPE